MDLDCMHYRLDTNHLGNLVYSYIVVEHLVRNMNQNSCTDLVHMGLCFDITDH